MTHIDGVVIKNTMNNTGVEEGMRGFKRQMGVLNSEMKANMSSFGKAEKSAQKYQTRLTTLDKQMKVQKRMFEQSKNELDNVKQAYEKANSIIKSHEQKVKSITQSHKTYDDALRKSNQELKKSDSELKKAQARQSLLSAEKSKAKVKLDELRKAEQSLKNSTKATTEQVKQASNATKRQREVQQKLIASHKEESSNIKKLKNSYKGLETENKKIKSSHAESNDEVKKAQREYNKLSKTIKDYPKDLANAEKAVNNERTSMNNLQKSINRTSNEMKAFNKEQLIANSQFTKTANHLDDMSEKFGKVGHNMTSLGRSMTIGVTTPIVAGFGASVKAAVDYEQALAGVAKTTNLSGSELNKMSNEITGMSKKMPFASTEIAGVAEAAGQLGVKKSEITDFTKTMLDMSVATNLSSEEAATEFARFANAAGMPINQVDRLGSSVVALGNSTATTEKEIVEMGQRLAGAGAQAGFSGDQIMSISAAMSSVGIEAEAGGTAMTQIFNKMTKATADGGKTLDNFGKASNMSAKEFADTWEKNPTKALSAFVEGLSNTEGGAKGVLKALDSVGIKGIREADTIRRLSNNHEVLDKALRTGSKGWKENNALTNEAKTRYKTMGSQLQIFKNQLFDLGKDIGNVIAPVVVGITKKFGQWTENFQKLPKPIKGTALALGLVAGATGPVVLGLGLVLRAIGSAAKGYAGLNRQMAINTAEATVNAGANKAAAGSIASTGKATKGQQGIFGKLVNVLSVTTGKYSKLGNAVKLGGKLIGKATIPFTILTTIFGVAYEKMDWFKQGFSDMGKFVNQVGFKIDFSWIGKMGKEWDEFKTDMAKGLQDGALFKGVKKGFDGLHHAVSKATDTTNVFGKGVSKGTKKALEAYNDLSEKAQVKLNEIRITHKKIGDKEYNQIKSLYKNINDEVNKQLDKRHNSEVSGLQKIFKDTNGLSKTEEAKILENIKKSNKNESREARRINNQILGIYSRAHNEKRSLTKKENDIIAGLQRKLDKSVVKSLSKGEVEQKAILERMKQNKGKLSMQAAAKVIKESAKERDTTIKNAKKKYKSTVAEAVRQRDETGTLSKSQADKVIKDAKKQYEESKGKAKKQHKAVVDQAQKQNKGVKKNIDGQTGHVKSKWEIMKESSIGGAKKISKKVVGYFKDTHKGANKWWDKIGSEIASESKGAWKDTGKWFSKTKTRSVNYFKDTKQGADKWWSKLGSKIASEAKGAWKDTGKWFSKTKNKSIAYFKDTKNGADKWWNKLGSKIADKSKDSYNSARKWFGKMKDSTGDRLSKMWGKAKDIFGNIADEGENKSKKTHGSWKSWLGKTLDWIKNISKDFGKAASDLGKTVANKAVDGLNGMIGGINKISKAITDKTLIKPIPHLSTGTYDGSSVTTDSNGGLKRSTMAVVNDKGTGNAPGGGVQEVIERADGSFHAPQGRNVVVPLGPGDIVHNAMDTKRYQDMGLLPKFHGGTKKKKKDDKITDLIADKVKDVAGGFKEGASKTAHNIKEKTENGLEKADDLTKKGASWLGNKIGDVWDYISHPKKLVNKVLDSMGIIFGSGTNATGKMAQGAYAKLKSSLVDKVKSMFDEFGGEGDASWLFKHDIWQRFGKYNGLNFNGGQHYGMDFGMTPGTPVYAVKGGKARVFDDYGGGHSVEIKTGANEWNWYMHLSKQIAKTGEQIKAGQLIAKSGNTGAFTAGSGHLHFQLMQGDHPGNDTAKDPESWLKSLSGGGQNKAASKWATEIRKAAGRMNVKLKGNDLNNIISLIQHESGGNAGVTQGNIGDINNILGTPAQGLLQYVPSTFKSYAMPGHGNIKNGYNQLLAFFNNKYWRTQFNPMGGWSPSGPRRYENGGLVTKHQLAEIGEGNKPEIVVPLTRRNRAVQLIEQAMQYVGMDSGSTNVTVNNDNSTIEKLLQHMVSLSDKNNRLTETVINLLSSSNSSDPKKVEKVMAQLMGDRMRMENFNQGQGGFA
ncbi:phage tail tape measure protein [Staphylococcus succinus]|uniref:phage tail tape measure protein n=1 Tax=Staphylococcus succinus TaxID=61015 RepID=UPI001C05AFCB|nr:phage tail tape measure protein [Staphylococcus succinus]MBU0437754.1 phage tail tape measure protein [Staphylococcus succinus]